MSFSQYLRQFLNKEQLLIESSVKSDQTVNFAKIKDHLESKVGGDPSDDISNRASLEGIETVIDLIPLDYVENPKNDYLEDIFSLIVDKNRIYFLEKFADREKTAAASLIKSMESIDRDKDQVKFVNYLKQYAGVSERLLKLYKLLNGQVSPSLTEAVDLEPELKQKVESIILICKNSATSEFNKLIDSEKRNIEQIPNTVEGGDMLYRYRDLIEFLGISSFVKDALEKKEKSLEKVEKKESLSTKKKKRISDRLIKGVQFGQLPAISNEVIETAGDFFRLFTALDTKNPAWMDLSLNKYVFKGDSTRLSEFNMSARKTESHKEEDQLTYVMANRSWILSYIKGSEDGELAEKEESNYVARLENAAGEKEKEIKNYYLSREFNLGNFRGIQIKPEIDLPLHTKVPLAVSEEDRKKESGLRNILKGMGQIITGLVGTIPDTGNEQIAQANRKQNLAVFNGINSIIKGGVTLVGGKQKGRDYAAAVSKLVPSTEKSKVKEDMLSVTDSPGFIPVNPESPGQIMQTPDSLVTGMDTFALAGPGKKSKPKKKKEEKKKDIASPNKISSFSDFMKHK